MSGAAAILRRRTRTNARPDGRHTKAEYADSMRGAAVSMLNHPACNDEMRDSANELLERVGDMLTLSRAGWYPQRPKGWRP